MLQVVSTECVLITHITNGALILPQSLPSLDWLIPSSSFFMAKATFEVVLSHVSPVAVSDPVAIIKPTQFELCIEFCWVHFLTDYLTSVTHPRGQQTLFSFYRRRSKTQRGAVVVWIGLGLTGSCVWMLGPWGLALLGGMALLEEVGHCGGGFWCYICSSYTHAHSPFLLPLDQDGELSAPSLALCLPKHYHSSCLGIGLNLWTCKIVPKNFCPL